VPGLSGEATAVLADLPLRSSTPAAWSALAADELDVFLADHAVCEQQAALSALHLVARYSQDAELVELLSALAAEEVQHFRRVARLLHGRGLRPQRRRVNPYVQALHDRVRGPDEAWVKCDRLLVGALIEARSCERFTLLLQALGGRDPEVAVLLAELGPAERRHWETFHGLARRDLDPARFEERWSDWLDAERAINSRGGRSARVHG